MSTKRKDALSVLEKLTGGPLTLAQYLKAIRESEQKTQSEFAEILGITKSHLCDIEKERKSISLERALRFAERLRYSRDQFVRLALQSQIKELGLCYRVSLQKAGSKS